MKKKLLMLAAVLCCTMTMMVQTSCTNEDVPVMDSKGKVSITINPATLYEELNIAELMPNWLNAGNTHIADTVLIYDQSGNLIAKLGMERK